jgi:hypothetical protein
MAASSCSLLLCLFLCSLWVSSPPASSSVFKTSRDFVSFVYLQGVDTLCWCSAAVQGRPIRLQRCSQPWPRPPVLDDLVHSTPHTPQISIAVCVEAHGTKQMCSHSGCASGCQLGAMRFLLRDSMGHAGYLVLGGRVGRTCHGAPLSLKATCVGRTAERDQGLRCCMFACPTTWHGLATLTACHASMIPGRAA